MDTGWAPVHLTSTQGLETARSKLLPSDPDPSPCSPWGHGSSATSCPVPTGWCTTEPLGKCPMPQGCTSVFLALARPILWNTWIRASWQVRGGQARVSGDPMHSLQMERCPMSPAGTVLQRAQGPGSEGHQPGAHTPVECWQGPPHPRPQYSMGCTVTGAGATELQGLPGNILTMTRTRIEKVLQEKTTDLILICSLCPQATCTPWCRTW